jgi:hypothetical protein
MEHKEDLALQTITHTADADWKGMQFRSVDFVQTMHYKDQQLDQRFNERGLGEQRTQNECRMGTQKVENECSMGTRKVFNSRGQG